MFAKHYSEHFEHIPEGYVQCSNVPKTGGGTMKRPELNEVDLSTARTGLFNGRGGLCVTMSPGQWDALLDEAYRRGALLLEIDQNEQPVRAYQRLTEA